MVEFLKCLGCSREYPGQKDYDDCKVGRWAGVDKLRGSLFAVPPTPVPAEGAVTTPPCEEGSCCIGCEFADREIGC